jgi:hypothetical protein
MTTRLQNSIFEMRDPRRHRLRGTIHGGSSATVETATRLIGTFPNICALIARREISGANRISAPAKANPENNQ